MGEILYLALPLGTTHSWGVCGRYVTRELARMAPVCLVTDRLEAGLVGDELELAALRGLLAPPEIQAGRAADVESPVLQSVPVRSAPLRLRLRGGATDTRSSSRRRFSRRASRPRERSTTYWPPAPRGAARFCANTVARGRTIVQGVDPTIFRSSR